MKRIIENVLYYKDIIFDIHETSDFVVDFINRHYSIQFEYAINTCLVDLRKLYYCDITNSSSNRYEKFY